MGSEFDKEIDVILRRSREAVLAGESRIERGEHPDADQFAAFAENSIPAASRAALVSHFADCARCRSVLSNLMSMSGAEETAPAMAVETAREPWYRRFFVFPQVAYSMGALVLIFSAFFVYVAYRGLDTANDVSQVTEPTFDRLANTSAAANSRAPAASPASNTAPVSNSAAAATPFPTVAERRVADETMAGDSPSNRSTGPDLEDRKQEKLSEPVGTLKKDVPLEGNTSPAPATAQPKAGAPTKDPIRDADAVMDKNKVATEELRTRSAPKKPESKKVQETDSRQIGSRTFKRTDGVWVDSQYGSQPLTVVRRGTDDFNRLDSEVRSIANSLSGPIIVVTGARAVRIN